MNKRVRKSTHAVIASFPCARGIFRGVVTILLLSGATLAADRAQGTTVDLKLMSFNIRMDDASIGNKLSTNGWVTILQPNGNRRDRAFSVINTAAPDILGTEEGLPNQIADLQAALPGYTYYGLGRNGGNNGEHSGIFYNTARFTAVAQGDFWLSATPAVPGTTFTGGGSDTGNPRMATWLKLYDDQSHQTYFVLNTHWSLDTQARNQSAALIRNQIDQLSGGLPLIVMGDFNTTLGSTALQTLTGATVSGFKLTDAYRHVYPTVGPNEATYHNFTGNQAGSSIDHIFYDASTFTATAAEIVHTSFPGGLYPSDHFPLTATLRVTVVPEPGTAVLLLWGMSAVIVMVRRSRTRS